MNKRGFAMFLSFLVTGIVFMFATSSQQLSITSLDTARSIALEATAFHAADGGLERGLARLRNKFEPFSFSYSSKLSETRKVLVKVAAKQLSGTINLSSESIVIDGNKEAAKRTLSRMSVQNLTGREGCGKFTEAI